MDLSLVSAVVGLPTVAAAAAAAVYSKALRLDHTG